MKFMFLLHDIETSWTGMNEAEQGAHIGEHQAYVDALMAANALVAGEPLAPAAEAKIIRAGGVQDGPYADTKEQIGGFYVIEAPDMETAVSWAQRCPSLPGGAIEVRPVPNYAE